MSDSLSNTSSHEIRNTEYNQEGSTYAREREAPWPRPPWGKRGLAFLIDAAIATAPLAISMAFMMHHLIAMMAYLDLPPFYQSTPLFYVVMALFYLGIPWFLFFGLCRDGFRKGSPGKRLFGLLVIQLDDGNPCTMKNSAVRNLLMVLIAMFHWFIPLLGFLGLLVEPISILRNPQGRRLGDGWAGTMVVE